MTHKRFSLGLLLSIGALSALSAGCEVSTCSGDEDCVDFDDGDDGSLFDGDDEDGSGDGADDVDAGDGDGDGSDLDGGVDAGDGDAGPVEPGDPITQSEFCERQLAPGLAWVNLTDNCCLDSAEADDVARLLGAVGYAGGVADCETRVEGLLAGGKVTYDAEYAAACADAFADNYAPPASEECPAAGFRIPDIEATYAHGAQVLAQIPACRAALAGTVADGGECANSFECADARVCGTQPGGLKRCVEPETSGPCANVPCAPGYVCVGRTGDGQCLPVDDLGNLSEGCSSSVQCKEGLWCNPVPDAPACAVPATCSEDGDVNCDAICVP